MAAYPWPTQPRSTGVLRQWDRRDEREHARLRGVTYSVKLDGQPLELTT